MTQTVVDGALQDRAHKVYGSWAPEHTDGQIITVRDYDQGEYYQRSDLALIESEPNLEFAEILGHTGMGKAAYDKLGAGYDENNVLAIVQKRHEQGKSTLIPTLHLRNVLDTAMTHNRLFVSSGGDPEIAAINDIIANPMMSRLTIGGFAVIKSLITSGNVDMALPVEAALRHGMSEEDAQILERLYGSALKKRLMGGVAVHWSLTGTRGVQIITQDGEEAMSVNRVHDGIANIVRKRAALAIPVPMDVHFGDCKVEVLRPRPLNDIGDVHKMMEEMAEVASNLASETIYYGLPEGAEVL